MLITFRDFLEAGPSLEFIEQKLKGLLGENYQFGQTLSYLYSPIGIETFHQAIHSDRVSGDSYHGLEVLTDDCDPTIFQILKEQRNLSPGRSLSAIQMEKS